MLVASIFASAVPAQVGHPAKGSWSGYWGTSDASKRRILLVLDWRDQKIIGVINPGPNQVPIDKAELDVDSWTLRLEAAMPTSDGGKAPFVGIAASSRKVQVLTSKSALSIGTWLGPGLMTPVIF